MLDIKYIRENQDTLKKSLRDRNCNFDFDAFLKLDERRRELIKKTDELRSRQNKLSDEVNVIMREKEDAREKINESKNISNELIVYDEELKKIKKDFDLSLLNIPNIPHQSVPVGDASSNKIIRNDGSVKKLSFNPLTHIELTAHLDIIDFKRASKISGANFALYKGLGARLERALINFMLDLHVTEHGYKEVFPPFLVNRASMTTTGQLPKLEEDMYRLKDDDYFLIPTAEVPVTNIHRDETLDENELPIYYVSFTSCFRREAGSYGKDTKGLIRVHQFDKVELVKFVKPTDSYDELEKLLKDACRVIELLEIPFRVVLLATGDLSFAATKCYDIEIYAPGIDKWLEVSSCSNFEDFQARRGNMRYRHTTDAGRVTTDYLHTLNGSGVALARLVVAILENYQESDGSVVIPQVLRRYFDGRERITQ